MREVSVQRKAAAPGGSTTGTEGGTMVAPFTSMAVAALVLAMGTGIVLTAMVARGTEMLAHVVRSRQPRTAGERLSRARAWSEQGG